MEIRASPESQQLELWLAAAGFSSDMSAWLVERAANENVPLELAASDSPLTYPSFASSVLRDIYDGRHACSLADLGFCDAIQARYDTAPVWETCSFLVWDVPLYKSHTTGVDATD